MSEKLTRLRHIKPIWIVLTIFFIAYFFLIWRLHFNYSTTDSDLAIYDQQVWFLSHLRLAGSSFKNGINAFGDHFGLIEVLIAPFYWLWNSEIVLLFFQELAIVVSAVPIYLTFKKYLKTREFWAILFTCSYLLYFGFQAATIFPFHLATLATVFIAWTIYFMLTGRWRWYWVMLILAMICKEDVPLFGIVLGVYLLFKKNTRKVGIATFLISFIYFELVTGVIIPYFVGRKYSYFVSALGNSPLEIIINAALHPIQAVIYFFTPLVKLRTMIAMFASFAFLPLLSIPFLWLLTPFLAERFLNDTLQRHLPWMHYSANQGPLLAYGAIFGLVTLLAYAKKFHLQIKPNWLIGMVITGMLLLTIGVTIAYKMPLLNLLKPDFYVRPFGTQSIDTALKLIPPTARVATQASLQPHLSHRDYIVIYPDPSLAANGQEEDLLVDAKPEEYGFPAVDYILMSVNAFHWRPVTKDEFQNQIDFVKSQKVWQVIYDQEGTTLFKRK